MAKKLSSIVLGAKPHLNNYLIWWVDVKELIKLEVKEWYNEHTQNYISIEIQELFWELPKVTTELSIPDILEINRSHWGVDIKKFHENKLCKFDNRLNGILVRLSDVTPLMYEFGQLTDHLSVLYFPVDKPELPERIVPLGNIYIGLDKTWHESLMIN